MKPVPGVLIFIAAVATTAACSKESRSVSSAPLSILSPTPVRAFHDRLVFESDRDGASAVYFADATGVRRLAAGSRPALSSDGTRVVFECERLAICVVNSDGSGQRTIAQGDEPDWSPDGASVVYIAEHDLSTPGGGLFTVTASGGTPVRLVASESLRSSSGWKVGLTEPAWSPDGSSIVFVAANWYDASDMYLINPNGSGLRLTGTENGKSRRAPTSPFWSADGAEIGAWTINGVDAFNLTTAQWRPVAPGHHLYATWSSRGDLTYSKQTGPGPTRYGGPELRIFISEAGQERQLIPDAQPSVKYSDIQPDWGH